jgi:hypothetical protein
MQIRKIIDDHRRKITHKCRGPLVSITAVSTYCCNENLNGFISIYMTAYKELLGLIDQSNVQLIVDFVRTSQYETEKIV